MTVRWGAPEGAPCPHRLVLAGVSHSIVRNLTDVWKYNFYSISTSHDKFGQIAVALIVAQLAQGSSRRPASRSLQREDTRSDISLLSNDSYSSASSRTASIRSYIIQYMQPVSSLMQWSWKSKKLLFNWGYLLAFFYYGSFPVIHKFNNNLLYSFIYGVHRWKSI